MRVELTAFTRRGEGLARRAAEALSALGHEAALTREGLDARSWAGRAFSRSQALVFVGAAGIAVRACAPWLKSKASDPAVLVLDEGGHFVIPLLSGHLGGANDLARALAGALGAECVLTTATDVRGAFPVDQWARVQGLAVENPEQIVSVSARVLEGETVGLFSPFPVAGEPPKEVVPASREDCLIEVDWRPQNPAALHLVPPTVTLGVGCRRGTAADTLRAALERVLSESGVSPAALGQVCSIDLKKDEPGLLELCRGLGLPLRTAPAEELRGVEGTFASSAFVASVTGVDNVCERAAVWGGGTLIWPKTAWNGVTLALAGAEPKLDWRWRT